MAHHASSWGRHASSFSDPIPEDHSDNMMPETYDDDGLPSEAQLVLLCLDYLRGLRRSYSPEDLFEAEGIDADYLSLAVYGLSRSFTRIPLSLKNDPHFSIDLSRKQKQQQLEQDGLSPPPREEPRLDGLVIPHLEDIQQEILYLKNPNESLQDDGGHGESKQSISYEEDEEWYAYNDDHVSNSHRFYPLNGLAAGPSVRGPLTMGEIVAAGLAEFGARSRGDAEEEMVQSPLFDQFFQAVEAKGFFRDLNKEEEAINETYEDEQTRKDLSTLLYEERYAKVANKFRTKLAAQAESQQQDLREQEEPASSAVPGFDPERQDARRKMRADQVRRQRFNENPSPMYGTCPDDFTVGAISVSNPKSFPSTSHPVDEQEAEKFKIQGNSYMQAKKYDKAVDMYTSALKLSPSGPNSHVFFSNRAAAYLSQRQIKEAILDSERSLALKPDYGKAHARLGLSHFLMGNYVESIEAYNTSLKYDPNNESSKKYREKATQRLVEQRNELGAEEEGDPAMPQTPASSKTQEVRQAEKFKNKGNSFMASAKYEDALNAYSEAILLCPDGKHSHVYYSNRAAALCYLERYEDAQKDSLKSLKLNPTYGKAFARLGLSQFFLGDYEGAVKAYTSALQFDPDNAASKSYLAKAKDRLKRQKKQENSSKQEGGSDGGAERKVEAFSPRNADVQKERKNMNKSSANQQPSAPKASAARNDRFWQNRENLAVVAPRNTES